MRIIRQIAISFVERENREDVNEAHERGISDHVAREVYQLGGIYAYNRFLMIGAEVSNDRAA